MRKEAEGPFRKAYFEEPEDQELEEEEEAPEFISTIFPAYRACSGLLPIVL